MRKTHAKSENKHRVSSRGWIPTGSHPLDSIGTGFAGLGLTTHRPGKSWRQTKSENRKSKIYRIFGTFSLQSGHLAKGQWAGRGYPRYPWQLPLRRPKPFAAGSRCTRPRWPAPSLKLRRFQRQEYPRGDFNPR